MTIAEHIPRDKHISMDFHSCSDVMQIIYSQEFAFQWTGMYSGRSPNAKYISRSPSHAEEREAIQFGIEIYCFPGRDAV